MAVVRSVAKWGSLAAMIVGAAVSVGITALVQACGGKAETEGPAAGDSGTSDAASDASDASDSGLISDVALGDQQVEDIVPTNDVSLDSVPAE